ncbi:MAG: hypothetical protein Tsb0016_09320 [Sphingomonadales bacterium]
MSAPLATNLAPQMSVSFRPNGDAFTPKTARQAAEAFESLFIAQMMAPMFEGIDDDSVFGGGAGQEIYRGMMIEHYGAGIAQRGGVGIADHLERYLLQLQETP